MKTWKFVGFFVHTWSHALPGFQGKSTETIGCNVVLNHETVFSKVLFKNYFVKKWAHAPNCDVSDGVRFSCCDTKREKSENSILKPLFIGSSHVWFQTNWVNFKPFLPSPDAVGYSLHLGQPLSLKRNVFF